MLRTLSITFLAVLIVFVGCKKQEQCAPGDTPEVCKVVQQCFASGTSTEVCRMGEKDAMQPRKSLTPAYDGAADSLNPGSTKAAPNPEPKPKKQ